MCVLYDSYNDYFPKEHLTGIYKGDVMLMWELNFNI
jgi:hypothetical protein